MPCGNNTCARGMASSLCTLSPTRPASSMWIASTSSFCVSRTGEDSKRGLPTLLLGLWRLGLPSPSSFSFPPPTDFSIISSKAAVLNLLIMTPLGVEYQIITLQYITVAKLQLISSNKIIFRLWRGGVGCHHHVRNCIKGLSRRLKKHCCRF